MIIMLNGKTVEIEKETKLPEFLKMKGLEPEKIIIEYNFEILKKEDWDKTLLIENDNLEILRFVGGG